MTFELPKSKFDMDTAHRLGLLPPTALEPHLPVLLTWLQDINWPVSRPVCDALVGCGQALIEPVRQVLLSNDAIWKFWVLTALLPRTSELVRGPLAEDITRIAMSPTPGELAEEAHIAAQALLRWPS